MAAPASKPPSVKPHAASFGPTAPSNDQPWDALDRFIDSREDQLVKLRRHLHSKPEASGKELASTALVADILREHGLEPRVMREGLGVVADVDLGAPDGTFIAIRAELDCVGVGDDKKAPYASTNPGLSHSCGHDAHTTIALHAGLAIHQHREQLRQRGLRHNIRVLFQPAEETATGARMMIDQGAIEHVRAILAVHAEPFIEPGIIGLRKGPLTSSCKAFEVVIKGKSGHSARPYQAIDPIQAATSVIDLFYQLAPRSMDSRYPLALTVGAVHAGAAFNAIPDEAVIRGTLRTARVDDEQAVEKKMMSILRGVEEATGCKIRIEFPQYAPATNNDGELIETMAAAATGLLGERGVQWLEVPSLGAEDFAFYQQVIPGAIVRLGAAVPNPADRRPLHSSHFDLDERALTIGAKFLTRSALMAAATFAR